MARLYSYPDSRALFGACLAMRASRIEGIYPMNKLPNTFRDDLKPAFGIPSIKPTPGQTFDKNNDLTLGDDGRTVHHRDGHVSYGGPADALVAYDKRHMTRAAFNEFYGDESEEEFGLLHGV